MLNNNPNINERRGIFKRLTVALASVFAATSVSVGQAQTDGQPVIEEIVVTALKRSEQVLVEAAAGISIIGGDDIEAIGADSLQDFLQNAPGVSITGGLGAGGSTQIQVRGINATYGSATVGFYMDDLPFSGIRGNSLPDPSPYDLSSVEVLCGPQGSLYGAGASGGVVLIKTQDAKLGVFEGKAEASLSSIDYGGEYSRVAGALNVPLLGDIMALRISGSYLDHDGWIDDTGGPLIPPPIGPLPVREDANNSEQANLRVKLRIEPNESLTVDLIAALQRIDSFGSGVSDADFNFPTGLDGFLNTDYEQFGAVIEYELPFATLRNAANFIDRDVTGLAAFAPNLGVAFATPARIFSNELRLNSRNDGTFTWVGGVFYREITNGVFQQTTAIGFPFDVDEEITSEQVSVFGEGTLSLMDGFLDLTGGLSVFNDDVNNRGNSFVGFVPNETQVNDLISPKVNIAIHPSDRTTLWINYAEGFRSGVVDFEFSRSLANLQTGLNLDGRVAPERSQSFELGAKREFMNGRLYAEVVAFYITLEDTQQSAIIVNPNGPDANTVLNAGDAKSQGFEWLLQYDPTDALSLFFSGSYADAVIDGDFFAPGQDPAVDTPLYADGTPLNQVPEWTLNASVAYTHQWGASGLAGTASLSAQYASERSFSVIADAPVPGDAVTEFDARYEVGRDSWNIYVFAENLTNEDGVVTPNLLGASFPPSLIRGVVGVRYRPRAIGAGARIRF